MVRWLRKKKQQAEPAAPSGTSGEKKPGPSGQEELHTLEAAPALQAQLAGTAPQLPVIDTSVPLLTVSGVERSFPVGGGQLHVLKGIDMSLYPMQLAMLKGRSGSGKTTLLNLIGGLDQPNKGEIRFKEHLFHQCGDNERTYIRRKEIGFIFQSFALMPLLSAWENVELSMRMAGIPRSQWKPRVTHCLELVGLAKRMHHRPFELSGGEQQRVAIAKAIAHKPSLLLADEPTAELDSQMGAQVMSVFRDIIETERMTICMTTHDPTIMEVADRVFEMVDGKFVNS
ncbi:ABC transporter ATP-binding protein [Paenibacillus filicis]|uniref:ABC transporter ATP-binding protein n=1 Tax=Paenibacillus filicis TaxID=669464 RepID=A0ABU9DPU9_9BACL